jgi:hypothetical protein
MRRIVERGVSMPDEEVGGGARRAAVIGPLAALGPSHHGAEPRANEQLAHPNRSTVTQASRETVRMT